MASGKQVRCAATGLRQQDGPGRGRFFTRRETDQDATGCEPGTDPDADRFPGWTITKDVYLVNYHQKKGANKTYKLKLENGDETLRVKIDQMGNFL